MTEVQVINSKVEKLLPFVKILEDEVAKVMVGQSSLLEKLLIALLSDGHILVEGVPGLAKTTAIQALADAISADFNRIQFTPDLLPADVIGTQIYSPKTGEFQTKLGPISANFVLADEINRAPAKVQSALLEAMQEKQVTIGNQTFKMPQPFMVLATQNPVEQEGTYPLPEAQIDRFMLKVVVDYPNITEEIEIMKRMSYKQKPKINPVVNIEKIIEARNLIEEIYVDERLYDYIANLVGATRYPQKYKLDDLSNLIEYGASPRASINLVKAAKTNAFLQGRGFVTPQDIKMVAFDILRHRVAITYEAEAEDISSFNIVEQVLSRVDVP